MREKVETSTDKGLKDQVEDLSKKIIASNRFYSVDLLEQTLKVETVRIGLAQKRNDNRNFNSGDRFNRQQGGGGNFRYQSGML